MASRKNPNSGPRGVPGTGIGSLGKRDYEERLAQSLNSSRQDRLDLMTTPIGVGDGQYLGWIRMPPEIQRAFLAGELEFVILTVPYRRLS